MAARTAEAVTGAGITATAHAASVGGDTVPADTIIRVINGGASPITLTAVTPGTVDGLAITDRTITINAGEAKYAKFARAAYANPATGLVSLTWSDVTSVTFEVVA